MRKEHKEILIKDLVSRLPYNTTVSMAEGGVDGVKWNKVELTLSLLNQIEEEGAWEFVKPYLRPMSSMTEEERKDWRAKVLMSPKVVFSDKMAELYDFCNSHYLDYRKVYDEKDGKWKSMIEMGLALEAPKDMYKFK